jgi:hypothetical protein
MSTRLISMFLVLISALIFPSCHKHNPPSTGTVSGSISPVSAASEVILTSTTSSQGYSQTYTQTPNIDGSFTFESVTPGSYELSIAPITGYIAPVEDPLNIAAGQNPLGEFYLSPNTNTPPSPPVQQGSFTFTLNNGTVYTYSSPYLLCTYSSPNLFIETAGATNPYYEIQISLNGVSGLNSYSISNTSTNYLRLFYNINPSTNDGYWNTGGSGSGRVTITQLNTTTRLVSGYFIGSLTPQGATVGNIIINGSFTNLNF